MNRTTSGIVLSEFVLSGDPLYDLLDNISNRFLIAQWGQNYKLMKSHLNSQRDMITRDIFLIRLKVKWSQFINQVLFLL